MNPFAFNSQPLASLMPSHRTTGPSLLRKNLSVQVAARIGQIRRRRVEPERLFERSYSGTHALEPAKLSDARGMGKREVVINTGQKSARTTSHAVDDRSTLHRSGLRHDEL